MQICKNDHVNMACIALLRGVNVGTSRRIEMAKTRQMFANLGFANVSTYLNSGNVIFETDVSQPSLREMIEAGFEREFGFVVTTLVKSQPEMKAIISAVPSDWQNDDTHKTDIAYLFEEIDSEGIIDELPIKRQFLDIRYTKGALFWNVSRENYNKSQLNKLISHKYYQLMTVRNVNTGRFLAGIGK